MAEIMAFMVSDDNAYTFNSEIVSDGGLGAVPKMHLALSMGSWALCLQEIYRVTHLVGLQVLLTSKQKLHFSLGARRDGQDHGVHGVREQRLHVRLGIISDGGLGAAP